MSIDVDALKQVLASKSRAELSTEGFRKAAVLVPLVKSEAGLELLFTVRSKDLAKHSGEISFPGGRLDEGETLIDAALRETFEEVGLRVGFKDILGYLDDRPSPFEYVVTPVLALIEKPKQFVLNPSEVAEVFSVSIKDLQGVSSYTEERFIRGQSRMIYFYPYQEKLIWGLTGNIVKNVLDILYSEASSTIK